MRIFLLTLVVLLSFSPLALATNYDWDEIPKLNQEAKEGKKIQALLGADPKQTEWLVIHGVVRYTVDFRMKLCFVGTAEAVPIDCQLLKKGYPELDEVWKRLGL